MRSRVRFSITAQPRQFWQNSCVWSFISSNHGATSHLLTGPVFVHTHARTNTYTSTHTLTTNIHTKLWTHSHISTHTLSNQTYKQWNTQAGFKTTPWVHLCLKVSDWMSTLIILFSLVTALPSVENESFPSICLGWSWSLVLHIYFFLQFREFSMLNQFTHRETMQT